MIQKLFQTFAKLFVYKKVECCESWKSISKQYLKIICVVKAGVRQQDQSVLMYCDQGRHQPAKMLWRYFHDGRRVSTHTLKHWASPSASSSDKHQQSERGETAARHSLIIIGNTDRSSESPMKMIIMCWCEHLTSQVSVCSYHITVSNLN